MWLKALWEETEEEEEEEETGEVNGELMVLMYLVGG